MDPSYICYTCPTAVSSATIQTEEAFLAHARKVLASLQQLQTAMGSSNVSQSVLKVLLEDLMQTIVCLFTV
jgi:hypothetical protein